MRPCITALLLLTVPAMLPAVSPAWAQPDAGPGLSPNMAPGMAQRLSRERVSAVAPGLYSVQDGGSFVLQPYEGGRYLLRFTGSDETFVLTMERGSLGAKLLKYDTGALALKVSVWGGLTLYSDAAPQGLPATWQEDAPAPATLAVSAGELQAAFSDETGHLSYVQNIVLRFSADPAVLSADAETRGRAFDALTNAADGIARFLATAPAARPLLAHRVTSVKMAEGGKPTVTLAGQTLLVSFVPGEGHEGHASSLAIAQELEKLFAISPRDVATK